MKQYFILAHDQARKGAMQAVMQAPEGYCVEIKEKTRSLDQNARLWALLTDLSNQVNWYGRKLSPENWKHVMTAALTKQDVVPNIDGSGFVVLGQSTSKMGKKMFGDLMTLIEAFGVEHNVKWSGGFDE